MPAPYTSERRRGIGSTAGFGATVAGLVVLVAGFHLLTLQEGVGWFGDPYQYLLHAENIVQGRPYADTGYIHNPERYMAPVAYPAGFPLLLVPVIALFGMDARAIVILMTLVWAGTVTALAYLFRYESPPRYVYGLVLAIGLQPYLWALKHEPLSDLPFLLGTVLSLLCYERAARAARDGVGPERWAVLAVSAGVAAAYAITTRPLALVLLPSFLLVDLVRARRPTGRFVIATASCGVLYGFYIALVDLEAGAHVVQAGGTVGVAATGGGYGALIRIAMLQHLGDIPRHVVANIVDYARATFIFWHVPGSGGAVLKNALMGLSLIPVGLGFGHRVRRRFGAVEAFCLLYALSLLPWSFSGVRYLAPLVPFYYFYLFVGLERMRTVRGGSLVRAARGATAAVAGALLCVYALQYRALLEAEAHPSLSEIAADPVYAYLREETSPSAMMITSGDPRPPVFFSRRAAAAAPQDVRRWPAFAEHLGASYALVGGSEKEEVERQLSPTHFRLVASSEERDLYRILPSPSPSLEADMPDPSE